jgi:hypothetical protein
MSIVATEDPGEIRSVLAEFSRSREVYKMSVRIIGGGFSLKINEGLWSPNFGEPVGSSITDGVSGSDMARRAPRTAARLVLITALEDGDVQNAWAVLVQTFGFEIAADLVQVAHLRDPRFAGIDVANLIADLRLSTPEPLPED